MGADVVGFSWGRVGSGSRTRPPARSLVVLATGWTQREPPNNFTVGCIRAEHLGEWLVSRNTLVRMPNPESPGLYKFRS